MTASSRRGQRLHAALGVLIAVAVWWCWRGIFGSVVLSIACSLALLAWLLPGAYAPFHRCFERVGHGLTVAVSWILLACVFGVVFVPLRVLRSMARRDPLGLRRDPGAETYLRSMPPPRAGRFERMY